MALIRTGSTIVDIRGGFAGCYFHRDRSGLHQSRRPRYIQSPSIDQTTQRAAFSRARRYASDLRTLSYNIYRARLGLSMAAPPPDYRPDLK